ncbi:response regulator [Solimicrobium silvestre]|uniref:Response regulator receiver domain n=1 Tax=Solimicrobium silvestre TaxID=2099400 RepID=A0A2S9H041_9BURK|nr:response regulator [Solimicrobium silvestre]PRC93318.1 Response regulator receiver domain [Solimicrobium silvestre]
MANILVVDDEMGIRELLSEILGDEGHVVQSAENAQQARELRGLSRPDLVLLDIWMPDTDGVTLLKEWQRDGLLTMPVIMMSGHATIDTAVEATRIGALNFLEKPISLQKLLKAVQQGLTKTTEPQRGSLPNRMALTTDAGMVVSHQASYGNSSIQTTQIGTHHVVGGSFDARLAPAPMPLNPLSQFSFDLPLREARDSFERIYFEYHLQREGGSMTRVAERTGLERTHLYRKLKQLGVESLKSSKRHN